MNRHTVALLGTLAVASSAVSCGGAGGDLFGSGGSGGAGTTGHGATTGGTSSSGTTGTSSGQMTTTTSSGQTSTSSGQTSTSSGQTSTSSGTTGGCTCVTTPAGWTPVALTGGSCPAGFDSPQTFINGVAASPFTCECSCGGGTQVCSGNGVLDRYAGAACGSAVLQSIPVTFDTSCGMGGAAIIKGSGYTLTNVVFGPGPGCSASSQTISKPPPSEQHVTVCQPSASCNGGACLTAAEQGGMCITHPGTVPCPAGFPTATFVSLGVADTRDCSGCSCGSTLGCQLTGLLVDNDSACGTANLYNFTVAPGACIVAPSSYPFNAAEARATVTGSDTCATTAPSSPTGDVTLDPQSAATVCCP